jgi:AcrR family transcriptional regulator
MASVLRERRTQAPGTQTPGTQARRTEARRTQAERRSATRARLLDATVACLAELGYARTSTTEIVRRAGVSRGAQVHHFPTKADLVATAVEHVFERRIDEFRVAFARLPEGAHKAVAAIDLLWPMFDGDSFDAWLELAVAARTDPHLRDRLTTVTRRFAESVGETFRELFPVPAGTDPVYDVAPKFIFALLDGLALHRSADPDPQFIADVLEAARAIARVFMSEPAGPDSQPTTQEVHT